MATSSKRRSAGDDGRVFGTPLSRNDEGKSGLLAYLAWFGQAAAFVFMAAAMVSMDAGDWPSVYQRPNNMPVHNWCGLVGAWPAYHAINLLGVGAWLLLGLWGLYIVVNGFVARVSHPWLRFVGGVVMAVAVGGLQAMLWKASGSLPNMGGGIVGTSIAAYMQPNFSTMGSSVILLCVFFVGAVVAVDVWVIIAPQWAAKKLAEATPPLAAGVGAAAVGTVGAGRKLSEVIGGMLNRDDAAAGGKKPKKKRKAAETDMDEELDVDALPTSTIEGKKGKKAKAGGKGEETEATETIDETAGGLGGTESFDPDAGKKKGKKRGEIAAAMTGGAIDEDEEAAEDAEAAEYADEDEEDDAEADETPAQQAGGAGKKWSAEELRAKIAKLPLTIAGSEKRTATQEDLRDIQSMGDMEGYKFPGLDQLEEPEANFSQTMESYVREQAGSLERSLKEYRIDGEVVGIQSGPVITNYEIRLAPGTKVNALTSVSSDLARSLKAVNVRIVANTAGRDTVGVEVPNAHKEKVRLKELMGRSEKYAGMSLPMFLGKDASGEPLIVDLTKMPHMLIAGTTGSGKSVCMNSILMSFMYTKKPNELKLVLVDPKMVELSQFKDIPHLMCPVVTEMSKAAAILEWAVRKMDERYELLAEAGCTNVAAYNSLTFDELKERFNCKDDTEAAKIPKKLPYMVFVIDELADLMMTNKEVEASIIRLAQKARAVGMHLILATQRPQANVVTGLIKSNMPSRIAFKVASGMDSRIVMDQKGAELLLGQGDMLFLSPRSSELQRAQGTLVDDREIRRVVKFLKDIASPTYERSLMQIRTGAAAAGDISAGGDELDDSGGLAGVQVAQNDPLFVKAVEHVLEAQTGSVSLLQRRFAIGYTRASKLIEAMGQANILGPHVGTQARQVLISGEEWHAMKEQIEADKKGGGTGALPGPGDTAINGAAVRRRGRRPVRRGLQERRRHRPLSRRTPNPSAPHHAPLHAGRFVYWPRCIQSTPYPYTLAADQKRPPPPASGTRGKHWPYLAHAPISGPGASKGRL
ncbi:MAG: DNA translocase FtsK 4TM domain-containing protein [Phycisphaerales bacterium]